VTVVTPQQVISSVLPASTPIFAQANPIVMRTPLILKAKLKKLPPPLPPLPDWAKKKP
jgi:hypothetical protein